MIFVYLALAVWCTPIFEYPFHSTNSGKNVGESYANVRELLSHIQHNEYQCYQCLWNGSSIKHVSELLKAPEKQQQQQDYIDKIRKVFNFLSLANLLVVYMVFGGPKSILIISAIHGILMCISPYVTTSNVLYFAGFVILVSLITCIKSAYIIMLNIYNIGRRVGQEKTL